MKIELIAAMSENKVIGVNNQLPWHLSEDLKHFKKLTMGKPILMGRKTYESIGKPLPKRTNIVLTSDPAYVAPGCVVVNSIDEALEVGKALDGFVVIGGAEIYKQFLDMAEVMYLTMVHTTIEGNAHFPMFEQAQWEEEILSTYEADEKHPFSFTFKKFSKREADSSQRQTS